MPFPSILLLKTPTGLLRAVKQIYLLCLGGVKTIAAPAAEIENYVWTRYSGFHDDNAGTWRCYSSGVGSKQQILNKSLIQAQNRN